MRISSCVGGRWQNSRWASTPRPTSVAGRVWRHRVQRHTGQPFPISHHLRGLPSGPSTAGSRGSKLPVTISKRNSGGGRYGWSTGPTGRGLVVGPGSPLRPHTRATARAATHTFSGGWLPTCGKPWGGPSFWTGTGTGGRANNNNKREGRGGKISDVGGRKGAKSNGAAGTYGGGQWRARIVPSLPALPRPAPAWQGGEGVAGPGRGRPARNQTGGRGMEGEGLSETRRSERTGEEG